MPSKLPDEEIIKQIRGISDSQWNHPVEMILFFKQDQSILCEDTQLVLGEIRTLFDKLYFSVHDLDERPQIAQQYQIDLVLCLIFVQ